MFKLIHNGAGDLPAVEYLACGAITPKEGLCVALDASTGLLAVSVKPTHICLREAAAAVTSGTVIPVIKITQDMLFESELDGSTSFKKGQLCDVASGGLKIDADGTTNQIFLIEYLAGTATGAKVRGRFVRSDGQDNVDATASAS